MTWLPRSAFRSSLCGAPTFADASSQRRVFDSGYYAALNDPKVTLLQDDTVVNVKGDQVITKKGVKVKADVIVLSTVR